MMINPNMLRRDIARLLNQIDTQIKEVESEAQKAGVKPEEMRDANGNWVMTPLLVAKVQGFAALIQLNASERDKK